MTRTHKIIISTFLSLIISLSFFSVSQSAINLGQDDAANAWKKAGVDKTPEASTYQVPETVGLVIKIALSFAGSMFLLWMVYAGILWMTARGEEEQVKKAQKIIPAAIIGLIITAGAYAITNFVFQRAVLITIQ